MVTGRAEWETEWIIYYVEINIYICIGGGGGARESDSK